MRVKQQSWSAVSHCTAIKPFYSGLETQEWWLILFTISHIQGGAVSLQYLALLELLGFVTSGVTTGLRKLRVSRLTPMSWWETTLPRSRHCRMSVQHFWEPGCDLKGTTWLFPKVMLLSVSSIPDVRPIVSPLQVNKVSVHLGPVDPCVSVWVLSGCWGRKRQ